MKVPPAPAASVRSVIAAACRTAAAAAIGWGEESSDDAWITVERTRAVLPDQGWKLHVSASVETAETVLRRILPVLVAGPPTSGVAAFKVASSLERLSELNRGACGASQVGKFVTVYPEDDDQAVCLAVALDRATTGLAGPRVPSDRALHAGSLVHYRYGAFVERWMQTALGEVVGSIRTPDGAVEPDLRTPWFRSPAWANDPFVAAGVVVQPPPVDLLVAGRYLTAAILGSSPGVTVRLVVDLEGGGRRVLKEARTPGPAHVRLRHEASVLARLADDPHTPDVHDLFEHGDSLFLAMDHVPGLTLEQRVRALASDGRFLPVEQVVAWATTLAGVLGRMHDRGMAYGDLKPPHVIVTPDDRLFLVDLESVTPAPAVLGSGIIGTPGYASPERSVWCGPSVTDDVHALGAVLYFMATGTEPSLAPDPRRLLDRPVDLLNPSVPDGIVDLIGRCLDPDPQARPESTDAFRRLLEAAMVPAPRTSTGRHVGEQGATAPLAPAFASLARGLAIRICDEPHSGGPGPVRRDLDGGIAGVVLALAQAAPRLEEPVLWAALEARARWLATTSALTGGPLPGLYVGEAGIGAALLRAGQVLADATLVAVAVEKGRLVAGLPHRSPDLFNGTAGRLRFHLLLWDATGTREHLDAALAAGERLLATVERPEPDQAEWAIPPGYDGASGKRYLGYAHGVAGIADALLDLHGASGDGRFFDMAAAGGRRLAALAVPVLEDGSGSDWPDTAGGTRGGALWCHGGAGISRFLAHATRVDLFPGADALCHAAALSSAAMRGVGPGQCHGLAGNADALVDVYRATGDPTHLDAAQSLGRLLSAFLAAPRAIGSDDLMNGRAGVLACLLRLAEPDRCPHALAREEGHQPTASHLAS